MNSLFHAAAAIFTSPELLGLIVLGTLIGYVIGAIPGLNAGNVIAILMPLGLRMDPLSLMVFFVAIYGVSELGGSWPGITLNVPGTPASAAVALDGFPMAQRGEGDRALGASTMSAFIGLLIGAILLGTVTESIGSYALKFGPALMLSITVLGVSAMASMTGQSYVGSIIAGALGLALGTVGVGPLTGAPRGTFGILELRGGLPLLPVLIGLFGFAECLVLARKSGGELLPGGVVKNFGTISRTIDGMKEALKYKGVLVMGSVIGAAIGFIPGLGATIASWVAYGEARRWLKPNVPFGEGAIEGIVAAETANHSAVGGALIPTIALGVPGSTATAIIMAALLLQGVTPGPAFLAANAQIVSELAVSIMVGSVVMWILGLLLSRYFARLALLKTRTLIPIIAIASLIGGYAGADSLFDMGIVVLFGWFGLLFERTGVSRPVFIIAFILGPLIEKYFGQSIRIADGDLSAVVFATPLVTSIYVVTILFLLLPFARSLSKRHRNATSVRE